MYLLSAKINYYFIHICKFLFQCDKAIGGDKVSDNQNIVKFC